MSPNRQLRLAARPEGEVKASDFVLVDMKTPEPDETEFVVEITHISIDPAMRWPHECSGTKSSSSDGAC